eukprot:756228-Hanusia_phi.AAC.1
MGSRQADDLRTHRRRASMYGQRVGVARRADDGAAKFLHSVELRVFVPRRNEDLRLTRPRIARPRSASVHVLAHFHCIVQRTHNRDVVSLGVGKDANRRTALSHRDQERVRRDIALKDPCSA